MRRCIPRSGHFWIVLMAVVMLGRPVGAQPPPSASHAPPPGPSPSAQIQWSPPPVPEMHDEDSENEGNHLPIQVYYNRAFRGQPWREEKRHAAYREMAGHVGALLVIEGLLIALLARRRRR